MKIAIACDHAALHLKEAVRAHLEEQGIPCRDFGLWKEGEKRDFMPARSRARAMTTKSTPLPAA